MALSAASSRRITSGRSFVLRCPAHGKRSIVSGTSASTSTSLGTTPRTNRRGPGSPVSVNPSSVSAASSRLPSVADTPHVRSAGQRRRSRASASSTCTPRLLERSSCHSSTTTHRRSRKISALSLRQSSSESDSGVVTRAVGSCSRCRARRDCDVSPVRDSTVHGSPSSAMGSLSACSVSAASARSGVIQSTRSGIASARRRAFRACGSSAIASMTGPIQAAYVLPVPVAAWMSPDSPRAYASHTSRWN